MESARKRKETRRYSGSEGGAPGHNTSSSSPPSSTGANPRTSFFPRSPISSLEMVFVGPLLFLLACGLLLAISSQVFGTSFFLLPASLLPSPPTPTTRSDESQGAASAARALADLEAVWRQDTFRGLEHARAILGAAHVPALTGMPRLRTLERAAEMYAHMKDFEGAVALRREIVSLLSTSPDKDILSLRREDMAVALTSLANDLYLASHFDEALKVLERTMDRFADILPKASLAVLHKLESTVFECKGDLVLALQRFEQSMQLAPPKRLEDLRVHLDLLKRTRTFTSDIPDSAARAMDARIASITQRLLSDGPWDRAEQLPGNYIPGLAAKPWHSLEKDDAPQQVRAAAEALKRALPLLRTEYTKLRDANALLPEQECIHDVSGGHWRRFEITGYWRPRDDSGCTKDSPAACKLFRELQELQLGPIRAGFSAIGPRAHLKPHFGMTNGQLKFHLGLVVPRASDGSPCALFRVANETRSWDEGSVLYFDDSFEHEVWNNCDQERVVFQVVFIHPDLVSSGMVNLDDVRALSRRDEAPH